jgi:hypothetical protein
MSTGLTTQAASWQGAIETELFCRNGVDWFEVRMIQWQGRGDYRVIAQGPVGDARSVVLRHDTHPNEQVSA